MVATPCSPARRRPPRALCAAVRPWAWPLPSVLTWSDATCSLTPLSRTLRPGLLGEAPAGNLFDTGSCNVEPRAFARTLPGLQDGKSEPVVVGHAVALGLR